MARHSQSELMDGTEKPFLTQSMIGLACRCGEAFRRRYIEGEIIPPTISQSRGGAVHGGIEGNMRHKMEHGDGLPVSDVADMAVALFDEEASGEMMFTDDEVSAGVENVKGQTRDDVVDFATCHCVEQEPHIEPALVELSFEIDLPDSPVNVRGTIDVGTTDDVVVDFKTGGKRKSQGDVDASLQVTMYDAGFEAVTGRKSTGATIDTIVKTKTKIYRDEKHTTRDAADRIVLAERVAAVHRMQEAGVFVPADQALAWWCDPNWCGYYHTCPFVTGKAIRHAQND